MLCPKCGENNPANFRFCGMCGAVLEAGKTAAAPKPATSKPEAVRPGEVPIALRLAANPRRESATSERVPLNSGPSFLGLGQSAPSGPSIDTLRDKAFSGSTPTFVYEDSRPGRGRTVVLLFVLAILIAGVYVRYRYLGNGAGTAKPAATQTPGKATSAPNEQQPASAANVPPAQPATTPSTVPEKPAEDTAKNVETGSAESVTPKEAPSKPVRSATPAAKSPKAATHAIPAIKPAKPVAVAKTSGDSGDAAFRKGDAYLYGRGGVSENCDQAVKNLKTASAAGNAKARSAFGTMYATGHCVPRDLPTAYSWFASALRADPNNQILEKDLTAVWNQMTPPERQLATKIKQ